MISDEEDIDRADKFELKYNHRFEEPDPEFVSETFLICEDCVSNSLVMEFLGENIFEHGGWYSAMIGASIDLQKTVLSCHSYFSITLDCNVKNIFRSRAIRELLSLP